MCSQQNRPAVLGLEFSYPEPHREAALLEQNPTDLNREGLTSGANSDSDCVLDQEASSMAKPLSEDLRIRLVRAVEGGMSRRAAAERFGISVSSAVRFVKEWRESGATRAKRLGGDQRSRRIEEHHEAILGAIEAAGHDPG
jgi:transposase-like protein